MTIADSSVNQPDMASKAWYLRVVSAIFSAVAVVMHFLVLAGMRNSATAAIQKGYLLVFIVTVFIVLKTKSPLERRVHQARPFEWLLTIAFGLWVCYSILLGVHALDQASQNSSDRLFQLWVFAGYSWGFGMVAFLE